MRNSFPTMGRTRPRAAAPTSPAADGASLGLVMLGAYVLLSLVTLSSQDPTLNVASRGVILNSGGVVGAYLGGSLAELFGLGAYAWPAALLFTGLRRLMRGPRPLFHRWLGFGLAWLLVMCLGSGLWGRTHLALGEVSGGGFLGAKVFHAPLAAILPDGAAAALWTVAAVAALRLLTRGPWLELFRGMEERLQALYEAVMERLAARWAGRGEEEPGEDFPLLLGERRSAPAPEDGPEPPAPDTGDQTPPFESPARPRLRNKFPRRPPVAHAPDENGLPPLDLLTPLEQQAIRADKAALAARALTLKACLDDFGVQGEVQEIHPGPVVTMFEIKPASGVRINKIASLADDLALGLKAMAVRIVAPIPGKDTVGVEIPNEKRLTVDLRSILGSKPFTDSPSLLTLALGVDISGEPRTADLARMPHLLVAGATGAGKSVCLNSLILSFLFKAQPDQVKLLLVDPKRIELSVYEDLPHLVHPVVTDMSQAKTALEWAVAEMDRRYEAMALIGVRNIAGYNAKLDALTDQDLKTHESWAGLEPLPYLVIVIDELADLMFTAAKEAEMLIVRLAQLARAAGIHMILATQRPSVDVVTGLIKANFPCRISFQVTSKFDSRTILDAVGAEYLLGKGDMLFKPSGGKLERMHGAFVSDADVNAVTAFWKAQAKPAYDLDFSQWQKEGEEGAPGAPGGMDSDPEYLQAVDFVVGQGKASISLLQRRFRIGFNKAARYVEQMEADGIVGSADGAKPRSVLRGRE